MYLGSGDWAISTASAIKNDDAPSFASGFN